MGSVVSTFSTASLSSVIGAVGVGAGAASGITMVSTVGDERSLTVLGGGSSCVVSGITTVSGYCVGVLAMTETESEDFRDSAKTTDVEVGSKIPKEISSEFQRSFMRRFLGIA